MLPEDDADGEALARKAFSRAMIRTYWLMSGSPREIFVPADFRTAVDTWHDECRVIFSNQDKVPERWPEQALHNLDEAVDRLKNPPPEWH